MAAVQALSARTLDKNFSFPTPDSRLRSADAATELVEVHGSPTPYFQASSFVCGLCVSLTQFRRMVK